MDQLCVSIAQNTQPPVILALQLLVCVFARKITIVKMNHQHFALLVLMWLGPLVLKGVLDFLLAQDIIESPMTHPKLWYAYLKKPGNGTTVCGVGYTGFASGSCVPYFFYRNNGVCAHCPGDTQKWVTVGGAVVVLAVLFWLLFFHGLNIPTDFKITLQVVQLLSVFTIISDKWPPVQSALLKIFSFDVCLFLVFSILSNIILLRILTLNYSLQSALSQSHFGQNIT